MLNRTKFFFPEYYFDLFEDAIDVPAGFIFWRMFYDIYELDEKLQETLANCQNSITKQHTQGKINKMFHLLLQFLRKQPQLQLKAITQIH